jgi:hypothetical protein
MHQVKKQLEGLQAQNNLELLNVCEIFRQNVNMFWDKNPAWLI